MIANARQVAPSAQVVWSGQLRIVRRWTPGNTLVYSTSRGSLNRSRRRALTEFLTSAYGGYPPRVCALRDYQT